MKKLILPIKFGLAILAFPLLCLFTATLYNYILTNTCGTELDGCGAKEFIPFFLTVAAELPLPIFLALPFLGQSLFVLYYPLSNLLFFNLPILAVWFVVGYAIGKIINRRRKPETQNKALTLLVAVPVLLFLIFFLATLLDIYFWYHAQEAPIEEPPAVSQPSPKQAPTPTPPPDPMLNFPHNEDAWTRFRTYVIFEPEAKFSLEIPPFSRVDINNSINLCLERDEDAVANLSLGTTHFGGVAWIEEKRASETIIEEKKIYPAGEAHYRFYRDEDGMMFGSIVFSKDDVDYAIYARFIYPKTQQESLTLIERVAKSFRFED